MRICVTKCSSEIQEARSHNVGPPPNPAGLIGLQLKASQPHLFWSERALKSLSLQEMEKQITSRAKMAETSRSSQRCAA